MRVACIQPQIFQDRNKCYLQIELLLRGFLEKNQNCDIICLPERWVPYFRDPIKNLQKERGNDYSFIKNLAKEYNIKILSGAIWEKRNNTTRIYWTFYNLQLRRRNTSFIKRNNLTISYEFSF